MRRKSLASRLGRLVTRIGFFANELFLDGDVMLGLERFGVACEIAVGDAQKFPERREIGRFVDHEHAHDPEPYAVVKRLVYILDDVFQNSPCAKEVISCRI